MPIFCLVVAKIPQTPFSNSEVTKLIFTKFLHDVEALVLLLLRAYTKQYCITLQNARAKSESSQFRRLQKALEINWLK